MSKLTNHLKVAACVCALIGASGASKLRAQEYPNSQTAPDNSERDKGQMGQMPTADQQSENSSDRETARKVRQAIVQDKMLAKYAQHIKIMADNGMVTLTGSVRSAEDKQSLVARAAEVVGKDNVTDQLTVTETE